MGFRCVGKYYRSFVALLLLLVLGLQQQHQQKFKQLSLLPGRRVQSHGNDHVVSHSGNESFRVLIAQYGSSERMGVYESLLNVTANINLAYAIYWKYDYLILRGEYPNTDSIERIITKGHRRSQFQAPSTRNESGSRAPASRATYNKLTLVKLALAEKYDRLMVLDADAMLFDFSRDIGREFPNDVVVVAHQTNKSQSHGTGSINIDVTLWNLFHKRTHVILRRWETKCLQRIKQEKNDDDQAPLQEMLNMELVQSQRDEIVFAVPYDFDYGRGRLVKHFIRHESTSWQTNETVNEIRLNKAKDACTQVCRRYHPVCQN